MQEKNHPVRLGRQHRELQTSLYFMAITNMLLGLTVVILSRKRDHAVLLTSERWKPQAKSSSHENSTNRPTDL